ncbi:MAG TPA: allophanate hydrolase subunit 1 [Xanthobacteraceae bacterium]|nr:allophanate hydrolase subunit 1 [Xanthobacteraceae bacterium]
MSAIRYSFGGDEHVFAEIGEEMSLEAFFKGMAICTELEKRRIAGVSEICPSNASYLVRFDPDVVHPDKMLSTLKEIEAEIGDAELELPTRIVEIPVLYNDPWTRETLMRFRERHQDPNSTDIEYGARINGYRSVDEFIAAHSGAPWFVSMLGFVAGLPFLFQMVEREKQIEVPKYLRPRTDTPKLTVGHGGCFTAIYSVRGAGGYQLFGITPAPIYDPAQGLPYLKDFMVFFRPGDIVKWKPITREEYDRDVKAVEAGTFDLTVRPLTFSLKAFHADPGGYSRHLVEVLHGH